MQSINEPHFPGTDSSNLVIDKEEQKGNLALQIYGRRFLADQPPIEYLSEFLLVFNSIKLDSNASTEQKHFKNLESNENAPDSSKNTFNVTNSTAYYFPHTRLPLKLFAFFSQSKLDTRHPIHQYAFSEGLKSIKSRIDPSLDESLREQLVQTLQILMSGFAGVSSNRTWATYSFMPITPRLLGREVTWSHSKDNYLTWQDSTKNFSTSDHNFMARGGEVLFLQIAYLFRKENEQRDKQKIEQTLAVLQKQENYKHLEFDLDKLKNALENQLIKLLNDETSSLEKISQFLEKNFRLNESPLEDSKQNEIDIQSEKQRPATLGTIPRCYIVEGFLFANEMLNLLQANISKLEKIELLQQLFVMQVLRSLIARSRQLDEDSPKTSSFYGNYSWIVCDPDAIPSSTTRKLAEGSFSKSEEIIYRVIRAYGKDKNVDPKNYKQIDKHSFDIFRRMGKMIGFIVPPKGGNQRFVLTPSLLRLMVYCLIKPNTRIKLTDFLQRVFSHFGIALEGEQMQQALAWQLESQQDNMVNIDISWIEESLKQSGLLIELSDAVSIVVNP